MEARPVLEPGVHHCRSAWDPGILNLAHPPMDAEWHNAQLSCECVR